MNTTELNKVLSDEIYKLRAGKTKPERINAVTRACAGIVSAARIELMYMKHTGVPHAALSFFTHHGKPALPAPKKKKNGK